jgi:hypothetical protein
LWRKEVRLWGGKVTHTHSAQPILIPNSLLEPVMGAIMWDACRIPLARDTRRVDGKRRLRALSVCMTTELMSAIFTKCAYNGSLEGAV